MGGGVDYEVEGAARDERHVVEVQRASPVQRAVDVPAADTCSLKSLIRIIEVARTHHAGRRTLPPTPKRGPVMPAVPPAAAAAAAAALWATRTRGSQHGLASCMAACGRRSSRGPGSVRVRAPAYLTRLPLHSEGVEVGAEVVRLAAVPARIVIGRISAPLFLPPWPTGFS